MIYKRLTEVIIKPLIKQYLKFDTSFYYKKFKLKIRAGVFHPQFFFSSKYLANFIEHLDLTNKLFCEPCAGSGLISLIAYDMKAHVYCFDIDHKAIENIQFNFNANFKSVDNKDFHVIQSDGFKNVPLNLFEIIAINPPYFFKEITTAAEYAWNCGKNGEFFEAFFESLQHYLHPQGKCYMVLAENCDIDRIKRLAINKSCVMLLVDEKKIAWEKNYIFEITLNVGAANSN